MYDRVITITPEMRKEIENLPKGGMKVTWTPEVEDFIYENYQLYRKRDLAKILGVSDKTLFKKYTELREERDHAG